MPVDGSCGWRLLGLPLGTEVCPPPFRESRRVLKPQISLPGVIWQLGNLMMPFDKCFCLLILLQILVLSHNTGINEMYAFII